MLEIVRIRPSVDDSVRQLRPDFRAISITADGIQNVESHPVSNEALEAACASLEWSSWADDHIEAWRDAFRSFGAKPKKTPSSVEALRARVAKSGAAPSINAVVDLYNAISIRFALPVGGEDLATYVGEPRLAQATGGERFDTARDGIEVTEEVPPGEVIWRDDMGATCRRWNWRQCNRTRITETSSHLWFVLEALGPMPDEALQLAADTFCDGLAAVSPTASIRLEWLR